MYRKLGILNERQSMTPESYRADIPESDFDRYLYLVAQALAMVCKENDSLMILQVLSVRGQEALRYDERLPKRVCPFTASRHLSQCSTPPGDGLVDIHFNRL